ncbi:MAG: bifunctional hydroxymethylpyrimidine kinase/phosphomethylpyrimidine kinase [Pseudomonadota bacterium]|nr:bifunctional hydroxymethylpyrimidine kinase/phosphomethylpyrimidine kinase [Pseudomonadota bacterium]
MGEVKGRVLIIAGSDSGGGAGIQGDIKTVTCLGGYAATAITALTAQNTQGVFGIHDVPEDFIRQQMMLVLEDIGADAFKTGMLHKAGVIKTVAEVIADYPSIPLILDPVMIAKGGAALLEPEAIVALKERLIPLAAVITPNIPEAEQLSGIRIQGVDDMKRAAERILAFGCKAVLIKGGHLEGDMITDLLLDASGQSRTYTQPRLHTRHTHGTGCALASAIATGQAQGMTLADAVRRAQDYVRMAIENAPGLGKGHGPLGHGHTVRVLQSPTPQAAAD